MCMEKREAIKIPLFRNIINKKNMQTIILTSIIFLVLFSLVFILIDSNKVAKAEKEMQDKNAEMWAKIIKDNNLI